jgi:hypothetical protein
MLSPPLANVTEATVVVEAVALNLTRTGGRIVAVNPPADTNEYGNETEKPNPCPRQDATAKEAEKTDDDQAAEA